MTGNTDGTRVYSNNVKEFLKALWDGNDPSYERPVVARTDGERW